MSRQESRLVCVMMLCVALAAFGCSKKEKASTEEDTATNGETATGSAAPRDTLADSLDTMIHTPAEIWSEIEVQRNKLSAAITNGELTSVRPFAFGIRDLVVSLAERATAADPSSASKIQALVERVETTVSNLAEYGAEGNSAGAAAELEKLNTVMTDIEAAVPMQ